MKNHSMFNIAHYTVSQNNVNPRALVFMFKNECTIIIL